MKRTLLALAILALVLPAVPRALAVDVSVDFFYNNISGGSWIEVADYGYCWQPDVAVSNTSWRPYSDGYWAYTDLGWTWVSYEDFGWATYHYGRWSRLEDYGWVWVPGRDEDLEWGPAWVSWRTGGDYVGWAPLPPGRGGVAYEGRGITGQVDVDFDIGPAYYNFVDVRYIGEPVLRERIIEPSRNVTYINETVNVTNITYKDKVVYNYGPDINVINTRSSRPIQRLRLERQENPDVTVAAKSGALTKVQGDTLIVSAPSHIRKSTQQIAPPTVKTKVTQAKIDRGWSGVGDAKAQEEFKQKIRSQDRNKIPPPSSGAAAANQSPVATSPVAATSPAASVAPVASPTPFERGKGKNRNRPGEQFQQNAAGSPAGSPGIGTSPTGAASPGEATETERGKHKGRREQLPTGTPPSGAASPGGASTPAETTMMPGRGKHNAAPTTAPTAGPEGMPQTGVGKHRGNRQLEQGNVGASPSESANAPGATEQGKQKGRRLEQGGTPPAGGTQDLQGQGTGQGGKQRGQGASSQPSGPTTGSAAEGQQGQGGKKQKGEASPSPGPQ
jgi:hypothetical protein